MVFFWPGLAVTPPKLSPNQTKPPPSPPPPPPLLEFYIIFMFINTNASVCIYTSLPTSAQARRALRTCNRRDSGRRMFNFNRLPVLLTTGELADVCAYLTKPVGTIVPY